MRRIKIQENTYLSTADEVSGGPLKIWLGESARHDHHPLYEALVLKAREHHLAGATVTRGVMGYGAGNHLHTAKILQLSGDLPVLVEIVDAREKIESFLPICAPWSMRA